MTPKSSDPNPRLSPFEQGQLQASKICNRETRWLKSSWSNAHNRRGRMMTTLFRRRKRRFLDGFIERLEAEICRRAEAGDRDALTPPTVASIVAVQAASPPAPVRKRRWALALRKRLRWLRLRKPGRGGGAAPTGESRSA